MLDLPTLATLRSIMRSRLGGPFDDRAASARSAGKHLPSIYDYEVVIAFEYWDKCRLRTGSARGSFLFYD